ncbi:MAG: hypothetical protein GX846_05965 [Deltaproteobacteria bacterium]|nr:hypothetical protein [Deltaproteobacteria bacterium]
MKTIITIVFLIFFFTGSAVASDYIIIVNKSVQIDAISSMDAAQIFIGKKRSWENGETIVPVTLNGGSTHESFLKEVVNKSPLQFKTYWKNIVFTGKGQAIKAFDSENDLVSYIMNTKGAIGYISTDTPSSGVKKITVR